jgi:chromosomal replication initiator protein
MKSNVRELEGALIRLGAYASLTSQGVTLDLAKEVLKNFQIEKNRFLSIAQVQDTVSRYFKVSVAELKSSKKSKNLTYPRQIAMYLCRKVLKCSFPDIGSKFGGKDHSTVIHAVRKIETSLKTDEKLQKEIEQIEKDLNP